MNSSDMKNMVVLKNLPSNLIEEAIVVLKNNVNIKIAQTKGDTKKEEGKTKKSDYIVKEAEMHIAQYATEVEKNIRIQKANQDLEKKYMRLKRITNFLAILAILGIIVNILK